MQQDKAVDGGGAVLQGALGMGGGDAEDMLEQHGRVWCPSPVRVAVRPQNSPKRVHEKDTGASQPGKSGARTMLAIWGCQRGAIQW